jgi:hypothetical protein
MDDQAIAIAHSIRFRRVTNRYPGRVAEAYGLDVERALNDSDEEVAAAVAEWERQHDIRVRDWPAIGRVERALTD